MEHMYNEQDLEQAIRRTVPGGPPVLDFEAWRQRHAEAVSGLRGPDTKRLTDDPWGTWVIRFGRTLMKKRQVRFGAVAAVLLIALAIVTLDRGTNTAWSMDQTIEAMKRLETAHITGKHICGGKVADFNCWVRAPGEESNFLRLRFQCDRETVVVQGDTVYDYSPAENIVTILDGSKIKDLQYWYEWAQISPWLTGRLLETLQLVGRGWEQKVETDPNTGKEQIIVTCNHPPSNASAILVVDPESKLVVRGKFWRNLQREGEPAFDVQAIVYNPEIPDEYFEFEVPPGATVIPKEEGEKTQALFEQAGQLFHKDKKYAEAIEFYQQVYDRYPHVGLGSTSLMMIGLCHTHLGNKEKAIEFCQKALHEFPTGWQGVIQFYLGAAYVDNGQKQEALAAFEACLADAEGHRGPDKFPVKEAREYIAKLKGGQ